METGWQIWAVGLAVLAAVVYLVWKIFQKGRGKSCGCGREGK